MKVRRWIYLGLWILSLAAITCFGGAVSYGFFFGVSLLPVVCVTYIACVYFRFKIYQEIGNRTMVCGRPESYFFVLKNEDRFAYASVSIRLFSDFSYVEELPGETEYELLPGDQYTFETRLVCRYRGEYEVGVREVVVTDFLGLFRIGYPNPGTIKALVSPRVISLGELKSMGDMQAVLRREAPAGTEADTVVRDYVEGDPLNRIHWKATAREGRLKVRLRTGEEREGISIFCDTARYSRDRAVYLPLENKMLETLLALGFFFAGRDMGFTAYYRKQGAFTAAENDGKDAAFAGGKTYGSDERYSELGTGEAPFIGKEDQTSSGTRYGQEGLVRRRVQGMRAFEAFYREVDEVSFRKEEDCVESLGQMASGGPVGKIVFMVLHRVSDEIMYISERLTENGTLAVLYVVTDENQEAYVRQSSERRRIVQVPLEAGLEGIL